MVLEKLGGEFYPSALRPNLYSKSNSMKNLA